MEATTEPAAASEAGVAEFVSRFTAAWADPQLDRFVALFRPEVVLEQPLMPRAVGRDAAREAIRRLLERMPGIHGEVIGWGGTSALVFIQLRLRLPHGSRPLEWTLIDRIELEEGLIRRRVTYMDSLPLLAQIATRPRLWGRLARLQRPIG